MKLVIFDCDGTLVDSQHNITTAMAHAFTAHGLAPPSVPEILGGVGLSLTEAFARLAPDAPTQVRQSLAEHYRNAFAEGRLERVADPLYPGIRATIEGLGRRDDVLLGIATGKSRRGVARLLEQEGWHGRFLTIQTADDHPSKPHPSMILTAMTEAGVAPAATIMVGDTTYDMIMAANAGVGALGVGWGYHAADMLAAAGAHRVIADGAGLLEAIDQRLGQQVGSARD